jgi:uncharacterized protein (TIGR00369 family)
VVRGALLITPLRAPEQLFGLRPIKVTGDTASGGMRTAPWMTDASGRPLAGMLGVLLDDVVGQATLTARPDGHWPVTTELSIDVLADLPNDGTILDARSELLSSTARTGTARGEVRAPSGTLLAIAALTTHYIPGVPDLHDVPEAPVPEPPAARHLHEACGADLVVHDHGRAVLEVPPGPVIRNAAEKGHGGVIAALTDMVAAAAVDDGGPPLRTFGLRMAYLRPAVLDGPLVLTAGVVHRGRSNALTRVDVLGGDGRLCAAASVTAGAVGV